MAENNFIFMQTLPKRKARSSCSRLLLKSACIFFALFSLSLDAKTVTAQESRISILMANDLRQVSVDGLKEGLAARFARRRAHLCLRDKKCGW